jgi:hypothetical protein
MGNSNIYALIPAFNAESSLGEVIDRTKKFVQRVIVVNDGSTAARGMPCAWVLPTLSPTDAAPSLPWMRMGNMTRQISLTSSVLMIKIPEPS